MAVGPDRHPGWVPVWKERLSAPRDVPDDDAPCLRDSFDNQKPKSPRFIPPLLLWHATRKTDHAANKKSWEAQRLIFVAVRAASLARSTAERMARA